MYRRMYGKNRNYATQNTYALKNQGTFPPSTPIPDAKISDDNDEMDLSPPTPVPAAEISGDENKVNSSPSTPVQAAEINGEKNEVKSSPSTPVPDAKISEDQDEVDFKPSTPVPDDEIKEDDDEVAIPPIKRPKKYGPRRVQPRAAQRDLLFWLIRIDENAKKELEEEKKLMEEKEEKDRLEAEKLENLKEEVLLVESIDENIDVNTEAHHTDLFECTEDDERPQLVVRRGQEFKLTLTFQRPFDKEIDDLYLIFRNGEKPNPSKRTCAQIKVQEDDQREYMTGETKKWGACIEEQSGNTLTVSVYSPPDVVIGEWDYSVRTVKDDDEYEYDGDLDIVLLLNPWCEDDQVYMANTDDLKEYILNPVGSVYSGNSRTIRSKPWHYGQFQNGILEICLQLIRLANGGKVAAKMSDPVYIARALSRILNSFNEFGVLAGRWDGEYSDGTRPLTWKGSAAILKQYRDTKEAVKYGQCWVFSHLLTTVARAIGLPCRSVTNFSSAHDTDLTMTIDKYVDEEGNEVDYMNNDSVWNFHVWNEVWMLRPDLDKAFSVNGKYDGWQAVDATPQEESEGSYQCGPSPLSAIKLGEVHVGFDTKFIFGEVNAECCDWKNTEPPVLLRRNTSRVGKKISTKYPDGEGYKKYPGYDEDGTRLDVTDLYKAEEGSPAERAAVEAATEQGSKGDLLFADNSGVELSLVEEPSAEIGEDFVVKIKVTNSAEEPRTIRLRATVRPATYWGGLIGKKLISEFNASEEEVLQPSEEKIYEVPVDADEYLDACDDSMTMRVLAVAKINDFANSEALLNEDFDLSPPDIDIQGPEGTVAPGDTCEVTIKFKNPLPRKALTECVLKVDGDVYLDNEDFELKHALYSKVLGVLEPNQEESLTLIAKPSIKPKKSKRREITVTLASKELPDMEGSTTILLE